MQYKKDKNWMKIALEYAQYAEKIGEVPIGAVLILEENILGFGWNSSISQHDPTAHAEIMALRDAGKKIKNYRLINTTLYVTLQPCIMCFGAIIQSRIKRLVFGADCNKLDELNMMKHLLYHSQNKYKLNIKKNIMHNECSNILINFFYKKRNTYIL
jgi:tRNA(adenine34) deaminase